MHAHPHRHDLAHDHDAEHVARVEARPPTEPSEAVALDVGANAGALVLISTRQRQGLEVEIHPETHPEQRRHVWVLPRRGAGDTTVYAAVFPSLAPGSYTVREPDDTVRCTVSVPANQVTYSQW